MKGILRHKFGIPGVLFILFLGNDTSSRYDAWALNSTRGNYMWLCPFEDDSLFTGFGRLIKQATFARPAPKKRRTA